MSSRAAAAPIKWPVHAEADGGCGGSKKLTRVLVNVTVERSLGPVHVVVAPESTVAEVVKAAAMAYVKEGRRPLLPTTDPKGFELHYSQYSLESTVSFPCFSSSSSSSSSSRSPSQVAK